jgi:SAM-dependent methyltransferase
MGYRNCAVCDGHYFEVLHNLKFKLMYDVELPDNYDIVICKQCGFVYGDTSASQKDYDTFYKNHNIYENPASYSDLHKYDMIFNELKNKWNKEDSILEIGTANGELLDIFKRNGYTSLFGVDPSASCIETLESNGITSWQKSLLDFKPKRKFKNIILSHVLEHILDVKKAMNVLSTILEDDGTLYVEVPDSLQYIENGAMPFNFFDVEHINHFSQSTLITLVTNYGFDVVHSGRKKWAIGNNKFYPATWVLCRKKTSFQEVKKYMKSYIKNCLDKKYDEITSLAKSKEKIIVWGTGSFAQRMYTMSNLSDCNIQYYVDNNKSKTGKLFAEKVIMLPEDITDDFTILILSVYGDKEIRDQIKKLKLKNKIVSIKGII